MKKLAIGSLVVGLVSAAISLPYLIPAVQEINRNTALLKQIDDERAAAQTAQPAPQAQAVQPVEAPKPAPASAGPVSTGIANAFAQKPKPAPAPKLPGAGASINAGGAPSCTDVSNLKQAVNLNTRATPYEGQLRWAFSGRTGTHPCRRGRAFSNTGESFSVGKLPPGEYVHPTLGKFSISRR